MITTIGKNYLASMIKNGTGSTFTYLAVGSGSTAESLADTSLQTEITRVAITPTIVDNVITFTGTLAGGVGTGTLREAGLFNDPSSGTLLTRVTFSPIIKAAGDTVILTFVETIG